MGLPISIFQKLGFTGIQSLTADKVFDKYFPTNEIQNFEKFHIKFLQLCYDFNSGMLGKHYYAPPVKDIEKYYQEWSQKKGDEYREERKKLLLELLNTHVKVIKTDDVILMTGVVAPPAAMVLKKYSQNVPQLKRFRLNLVPDLVFVPTFAVATLCAVKVLQFKAGNKTK